MKSLKLIVLGTFAALVLSGCSLKFEGNYKPEYVSKDVSNTLAKVDRKIEVKRHVKSIISKKPRTFRGSAFSIVMQSSQITDNISKIFMEQYFSDVSFKDGSRSSSTAFLELDAVVLDYAWNLNTFTDGVQMDIKMKVDVKKDGTLLLSKVYEKDVGNDNVASFSWLKGELTLHPQAVETFHKGVFNILNEDVKEDLIKALKK